VGDPCVVRVWKRMPPLGTGVPAQFRVIVTRRPKYACRDCEAGIVQAPAKPRLIEGGMPELGLARCRFHKRDSRISDGG